MATTASNRPSRRAAASRTDRIVHSSDEETHEIELPLSPGSDEEFSIAPPLSHRKSKNADVNTQAAGSGKLTTVAKKLPASVESSEGVMARPPVGRRRNVRAGRMSLAALEEGKSLLPTPETSASPQPESKASTPLADITASVANVQETKVVELNSTKKITSLPPFKEEPLPQKPRDIVLRARARVDAHMDVPQVPEARIVITHLILTNFKSYAGKQEIGPFHASFSSVVGPNGSGKSNVIDSLLFVFGFRASKMRQGKISALIHSSAAFPDLEYCEVEVHFQEVMDQPCGRLPQVIPNSALTISRRAFKNNSSKYFINGSGSDFMTVTTLLKDRGVDLDHKRFLILQGEVESIAQMKPKAVNEHDDGLLEYLEDIIGTSKYKTPIDESAAEAEALNEVCLEKNSRLHHVEKEKNNLEGKKDAAIAYIRHENELTTKQSSLYQLFVSECNNNIDITQHAVKQLQEQLAAEARRHACNQSVITDLDKQHTKEVKDYEKLEQNTQIVLKQMAKVDKDSVKLEEKKKFLSTKSKKLEKTVSTSRASAHESAAYLGRLVEDVERITAAISVLEDQAKTEEAELMTIRDSLKEKTQDLSDEITKKQQSLEPWTKQINEKKSALAVAESEIVIIKEQNDAVARALVDAKQKISSLEAGRSTLSQELTALGEEKTATTMKMQELRTEIDLVRKLEPETRTKLSAARQKADEAHASLSHSQSQGNVLTSLLRLKDSGRLQGFHGRLGNLGTIDQKYDVAISTACAALDNFVVESVDIGQQCIEHLRKNNLGRANFILLDRLTHRDLSVFQTPENVSRLFDLVKPKDKRFQLAFYSVLQNTLIAKDLDQANRIAFGATRYRVVTLDGQLIDKSGTMSGGGNRVTKGAMSAKLVADTTKEQVAKLEIDRDGLESQHRKIQDELESLQAELRLLVDAIPNIETRVQKHLLERDSIEGTITDAQKRYKELSATKKPDIVADARLVTLQKTITTLQKDVVLIEEETSETEAEIKWLQDKIMEAGGIRWRNQKAKVDGLRERMGTLSEEMSGAEVAKVKTEKAKAKHDKSYTDSVEELAALAHEIEELDADIETQTRESHKYKGAAEQAQEVSQIRSLEKTHTLILK